MYEASKALLHSRKFLILCLDTVVPLLLYFAAKHASPSLAEDGARLVATAGNGDHRRHRGRRFSGDESGDVPAGLRGKEKVLVKPNLYGIKACLTARRQPPATNPIDNRQN